MPFQKGVSGNPSGRPPDVMGQAIRKVLAEKDPATKKKNAEALARKLFQMGMAGNVEAIKELNNRSDGKVKDKVELSGGNGGPVQITLVPFDAGNSR